MKRMTVRERRFLLAHIGGKSLTESYLELRPDMEQNTASVLDSRMMRRILNRFDWADLFVAAGLDEARLITELQARLAAKFTKFHQDKSLGDFEDNAVRMRATELLADLLVRRKGEQEILERLNAVEERLEALLAQR